MAEHTSNVAIFFGLTPEGGGAPESMTGAVAKATTNAVQHAAAGVGVVKTVLERGVPATQWAATATQVIALLGKELSGLAIPSLLAKGWSTYEPFRKYLDETKYPPTTPYVVPLHKHTISAAYHPLIELRLDGTPAGKVNFTVKVSITFDVVSVVIQNKRFVGAKTGAAEAKGTLECEGAQILERTLSKIDLPGDISFGDGFPIDPSATANRASQATRK
jgi:hypothetical protein